MNRRIFVSRAGAIAASIGVPNLWQRAALAAGPEPDAPILVVVELTGGNDGLNTVIPFQDDTYHRARPTLRVEPKQVLKLNDTLGLHPRMAGLHKLWGDGKFRVMMNVGYPGPSRSHSRSMEIWQSGTVDPTPTAGWLGRTSDSLLDRAPACFIGTGSTPLVVRGRDVAPFALADLEGLKLSPTARLPMHAADTALAEPLDHVARAMAAAGTVSNRVTAIRPDDFSEDRESLEAKLSTVCSLIESGVGSRIFYTSLDGFDTHANQQYAHQNLLRKLSAAIARFQSDLETRKLDKRVAVLIFSEFGRRIEENGSKGTDHGAASPVLLVGAPVLGGVLGGLPDLAHAQDGDVPFKIDFRDLYASLLADWLKVDPGLVIGHSTKERLPLFHA